MPCVKSQESVPASRASTETELCVRLAMLEHTLLIWEGLPLLVAYIVTLERGQVRLVPQLQTRALAAMREHGPRPVGRRQYQHALIAWRELFQLASGQLAILVLPVI